MIHHHKARHEYHDRLARKLPIDSPDRDNAIALAHEHARQLRYHMDQASKIKRQHGLREDDCGQMDDVHKSHTTNTVAVHEASNEPPNIQRLSEEDDDIQIGDKIHAGLRHKGGAGFKGKVTAIEPNGTVHFQNDQQRTFTAHKRTITKESKALEPVNQPDNRQLPDGSANYSLPREESQVIPPNENKKMLIEKGKKKASIVKKAAGKVVKEDTMTSDKPSDDPEKKDKTPTGGKTLTGKPKDKIETEPAMSLGLTNGQDVGVKSGGAGTSQGSNH